jgi:uncharacterized BrkB/YihY/UPF0761 family membrane protein
MPAHDLAGLRRLLERSFVGRCVGSFITLQGVDRSMAIASQAFTALIPLFILVSAAAPPSSQDLVSSAIVQKFELGGNAAVAVKELFAHSGEMTTGVLSVVLLVFSGLSLTRRLQRMYVQAWGLEAARGVRASVNAAFGLAVLLVEIALLYLARSLVHGLPLDEMLGISLSALAGLLLWTTVPWLLLDRRVPWRRLVPAGILASVSTVVYGVASRIYMPRLVETYSERYGLFGVTLALVGWLLAIAFIVVAGTVIAAEFDRAQDTWARGLRMRLGLETAAGARVVPGEEAAGG